METNKVKSPVFGSKIKMDSNGKLIVPDNPIIPIIEGDGIGADIWKASVNVFNAAVEKAYNGTRKVDWLEISAGDKDSDISVGKSSVHLIISIFSPCNSFTIV